MDSSPARQLLAQADVLLMFAGLLLPPDRATVPSADDAGELSEAAFPGDVPLAASLTALCDAFTQAPEVEWSDEYHRLFEGPLACPINETAYVRRDKGAIIADVCGFYRAFGFTVSSEAGEKPDHLRCELEFFALLFVMLAQAPQCHSKDDIVGTTRAAIGSFANDHLGLWVTSFCVHLSETAQREQYLRLAEAMETTWSALIRAFDLHAPTPPVQAPLPSNPEETGSIACGLAQSCIDTPSVLTVAGRSVER